MVDQINQDTDDIFIANSTYPNAKSIFTRLPTLDEIKDHCYVVLDTNVLLTPYIIGKEDLLDQCRKTYKPLSTAKRLIIPGQVAREFAKNRATKIAELYQQISRKTVPSMQRGKYPLLSSLEEYREVVRLEGEIDEKLNEYRQIFKKAIDDVKSRIEEWRWNDPVTLLYNEIFNEDTIVDPPIDKDALQQDLEHRQTYKIPPGYKDGGKRDSGIGDLLIWQSILEVGKRKQKGVIFVSGDEKADWYLRGEGGQALYPRYELVDEFRRSSEGQAFHIIKFSHFLELFGASEKVVQEVREEEGFIQEKGGVGRDAALQGINLENWVVSSIRQWIRENYSLELWTNPYLNRSAPDLEFVSTEGFSIAIEVKLVARVGDTYETVNPVLKHVTPWLKDHDRVLIFLVYTDLKEAARASEILRKDFAFGPFDVYDPIDKNITIVIGHIENRQFLFLEIFPPEHKMP